MLITARKESFFIFSPMKKTSGTLLAVLCFTLCLSQQLRFEGNVAHTYSQKPLNGVIVELINSKSALVAKAFTNRDGNYAFDISLKNADDYLVRLSYPGFATKYYSVSTRGIPEELKNTPFPAIEADLSLSEKIDGIDYSFLDKPLNHYYYNAAIDNYQYDKDLLGKNLILLQELRTKEEKQKRNLASMTNKKLQAAANDGPDKLLLCAVILALILLMVVVFIKRIRRKTQ